MATMTAGSSSARRAASDLIAAVATRDQAARERVLDRKDIRDVATEAARFAAVLGQTALGGREPFLAELARATDKLEETDAGPAAG